MITLIAYTCFDQSSLNIPLITYDKDKAERWKATAPYDSYIIKSFHNIELDFPDPINKIDKEPSQ